MTTVYEIQSGKRLTLYRLKLTLNFVAFMENMRRMNKWYVDWCDFLMKDEKMCTMMNKSSKY